MPRQSQSIYRKWSGNKTKTFISDCPIVICALHQSCEVHFGACLVLAPRLALALAVLLQRKLLTWWHFRAMSAWVWAPTYTGWVVASRLEWVGSWERSHKMSPGLLGYRQGTVLCAHNRDWKWGCCPMLREETEAHREEKHLKRLALAPLASRQRGITQPRTHTSASGL